MKEQVNELITKSGLTPEQANFIINQFNEFQTIAEGYKNLAMCIVVNSELETDKIEKAKAMRLFLAKKRIAMEKTRKLLKEKSLKEGQMIDGLARLFKGMIEPLETHLLLQENYIEIQEEKRLKVRYQQRVERANFINLDLEKYNLHMISDDAFETAIKNQELENVAEQKRIEAQKKEDARIEAIRIENEKKQKAENERIRLENLQLKRDKEKRDRELVVAQDKARKEKYEKDLAIKREKRAKESKEKLAEENKQLKTEAPTPPPTPAPIENNTKTAPLPAVLSDNENMANEMMDCLATYFRGMPDGVKQSVKADLQNIIGGYKNFEITRIALTNMSQSLSSPGEGCKECRKIDTMIWDIVKPLGGWLE